ncbi:ABC transporter substrate-binding protein [Calidifontibacter sp. DB0510]|uniref:ABC transporter substrate-binding protein n=2 Tax=Metallococcus carri TaxID=1656884 RepID=A0A967B168_9MICO|nr:ABC transporter substrate-binding protein [Metallococcus carri]NOP37654.1 ABC transporter substrate-binding protein [Calidifontibacter sp. DB2511S]
MAKTAATAAVAVTMALTGCSTKANNGGSNGGSGAGGGNGGVKTDVGVTDKEITLGALTDLSGVFKVLGLGITQGNQMWADDVNKQGGICGRQIKIITSDSGYSAEKAVPLYNQMKTKELGMIQLLGSPILAALKKSMVADKMAAIPSSWASSNLDVPNVVMVGATYDIESINGLSRLQKAGKIKDGDTIGHIYIDSEYGKNGALGSKYYASKHKMKLVEATVTSTQSDLTSAVTKLKGAGVKAILLTTTPAQTASALGTAKAQGMTVPIYGSGPTYTPQLLSSPVAGLLTSGQYTTDALQVPFNSDLPKAKEIAAQFTKEHPDQTPTYGPMQGYAFGLVWGAILKQACSDGDLTRAGVLKAVRKTTVDTQGLTPPLDFTKPGQPSTRSMFVYQPAKVPGGLKMIGTGPETSDDAAAYKTPFQK